MNTLKPFEEVYECDSITLNMTNGCNLNCIYCFEHDKHPSMMSPETGITIIDKAYRKVSNSNGGKFMVNFFGGEPFLNWDCMKAIIDHANEKNYDIFWGVTTNLTILTDEIIEYIDDNNIYLLVSADGLGYIHDKNRSGSYTKVMNNIQRLIKEGLGIFVEIRMTILPEDIDKALDGVKMFIDMGFDNICPCPVTDVEWSEEDIKKLEQYNHDMMEYYVSLLNDRESNRNFSIKNTDEILTNVLEPSIYKPLMCPIGSNKWCAFDTNGDIYPCHQLPTSYQKFKDEQCLGNIYTGVDPGKLSNGKNIAKYVKEQCTDCAGKSVCASGCPEENLRQTGNIDTPSDGYCAVQCALVKAVKQYQDKILGAENIRNKTINRLKENLKIKKYIDENLSDEDNKLIMTIKLMHLNEMIASLGEENIFPSFHDYFSNAIINFGAKILAREDIDTFYASPIIPEEVKKK